MELMLKLMLEVKLMLPILLELMVGAASDKSVIFVLPRERMM